VWEIPPHPWREKKRKFSISIIVYKIPLTQGQNEGGLPCLLFEQGQAFALVFALGEKGQDRLASLDSDRRKGIGEKAVGSNTVRHKACE
jgi:hypothetical protein